MDLYVKEGTKVTLDRNPPASLRKAFRRYDLTTLDDLVKSGLISSSEKLERMIEAAKKVTKAKTALLRPMPGERIDLRRHAGYLSNIGPGILPSEAALVWRIIRELEANSVMRLKPSTELKPLVIGNLIPIEIWEFLTSKVEVAGTMVIDNVPCLCNDVLIRKGGMIHFVGSYAFLRANRLKGEQ